MQTTLEDVLIAQNKRISINSQNIAQDQLQRRVQVVDVYGQEFTRQGTPDQPAIYSISVSPDLEYYQRFQFELILQPFIATFGSGGTTSSVSLTASTSNTSLAGTVAGSNVTITPNPHNHPAAVSPASHTHQVAAGLTSVPQPVTGFQLLVEGIDITDKLYEQHPGVIAGIGEYPAGYLEMYDLITVAGGLPAWQREIITAPGNKRFEIRTATGYFNATIKVYYKYSHPLR